MLCSYANVWAFCGTKVSHFSNLGGRPAICNLPYDTGIMGTQHLVGLTLDFLLRSFRTVPNDSGVLEPPGMEGHHFLLLWLLPCTSLRLCP